MESRRPPDHILGRQSKDELPQEYDSLAQDYRRVVSELNFLQRATAKLNFLNNAHDGIIFTDDQGIVLYANPYFAHMMQVDPETLLDNPLPDFMWPSHEEYQHLFENIRNDGFVREREMRLSRRDGVPVFAICSAVANFDDEGRYSGAELMFCNVTNKRQAEVRLLEQQQLLTSILSSTLDPIFILNADFHLATANVAGRELFDLAPDLHQYPYTDLLVKAGLEAQDLQTIKDNFEAGQAFRHELVYKDLYFQVQCVPLQATQVGWICALHNVTSLKQYEAFRTHMLHMVTHDLKNPLAIIIGLAGYLAEEVPPEFKSLTERIIRNSRRMDSLINNLLNLEKVNSGKLETEVINLVPLVQGVVEEFDGEVAEKTQNIQLILPSTSLMIEADAEQVGEAVANLVSNAIKYTPENGAITVQVQQINNHAQVSVRDTGLGIAKAMQGKLFQPFYRIRTSETAEIRGTGLGLSLVKAVAEAHHGSVSVESDEGQGSTFTFELPIFSA